MKDEESQTESANNNNNGLSVTGNGKGRYKVWAIAGILLLAFWSMFTGSVTLKSWAAVNPLENDINTALPDDLDILELEEREKLVRNFWNVYTHSNTNRLPRFWLEAFKAAYEDLINEVSGVRDDAISEIAKLSVKSISLESSTDQDITEAPRDRSMNSSKMQS